MKKLILFIITFGWLVTACNQQPQEATEQLQTEQQRQIEQTEQIEQEEQTEQKTQPVAEQQIPVQEGGTLYLTMRNAKTLNPLLNQDASVDNILKLIYMPLIRLDENHKPAPLIAQDWSFDEGGAVLTLSLRSDIYWQDGTNLTADDVIYSFDTLARTADANAVYKGLSLIHI